MGARSRGDDYLLSLAGVDIASKTFVEIQELYNKTLESGMHGLCFSPYMDGQGPGSQLSEEQVR
ncbi:MAG: glycosyl hydrolase, partial [Gammaproteobacteria bacterium]